MYYNQPTPEQITALIEAFHNPTSAREHGIQFNGASYKCVRADKDSIYAKKVGLLEHCYSSGNFSITGRVGFCGRYDQLYGCIWDLFFFNVP